LKPFLHFIDVKIYYSNIFTTPQKLSVTISVYPVSQKTRQLTGYVTLSDADDSNLSVSFTWHLPITKINLKNIFTLKMSHFQMPLNFALIFI